MLETKFENLDPWQQELLRRAEGVMKNAYNLYSHFYVGAALLTMKGNIYVGTFAENSSQGMTICAEPAAVLAANTNGERMYKAIAVIGAGETFNAPEPITPCGRCRQILYDFSQIGQHDIEVISSNTKMDKILIAGINELLPRAFGPKDVGLDLERFRK